MSCPDEPRSEAKKGKLKPNCEKLLEQLRKRCPEIPVSQVEPGVVIQEVSRSEEEAERSLVDLLTDGGTTPKVVWQEAGSEAVAHLGATRIKGLPRGLLLVGIKLETIETGLQELTVPFALGSGERLAGLLVTTERKPRGHEVLVDRWGEAVIATAWRGLLDLAATYAALAGSDVDGSPLVPAAIVVEPPRLTVVPRARFDFEQPKPPGPAPSEDPVGSPVYQRAGESAA